MFECPEVICVLVLDITVFVSTMCMVVCLIGSTHRVGEQAKLNLQLPFPCMCGYGSVPGMLLLSRTCTFLEGRLVYAFVHSRPIGRHLLTVTVACTFQRYIRGFKSGLPGLSGMEGWQAVDL